MSNKLTINILCLHGCNQTKEMFEKLTKQMRDIATTYSKSKNCEIVWHFIEAEYDHSLGGKTWYNVELDVAKIGTIEYDEAMVNPTLDTLNKVVSDLNIDVLIGFSQGGNVVDTYLSNTNEGLTSGNKQNQIKCAVIFSGYNLVNPNRNIDVETPVMNVYSDQDTIVPSKFMPVYKNMVVRAHDKGHKLPTSKPYVREIIDYIYEKCK